MAGESSQGRKREREMVPRSDVWPYYDRFKDDGKTKAQCKRCRQVLNASHGTTSLRKHIQNCSAAQQAPAVGFGEPRPLLPPPPPPRAPPASSAPMRCETSSSLLDEDEARRDLTLMIVKGGYDPSIVEDECFRSFVRRLNPGFDLPTRSDIEDMCDGLLEVQKRLHKQLEIQCKLLVRIQQQLQIMSEKQCKCSAEKVQDMEARSPQEEQQPPPPPLLLLPLPPGPWEHESDEDEAHQHFGRMMASRRRCNPIVVDENCFRNFLESLRPQFRMPLCSTIEGMCDAILAEARSNLMDRLRLYPIAPLYRPVRDGDVQGRLQQCPLNAPAL